MHSSPSLQVFADVLHSFMSENVSKLDFGLTFTDDKLFPGIDT